jgi:hypothetical protein
MRPRGSPVGRRLGEYGVYIGGWMGFLSWSGSRIGRRNRWGRVGTERVDWKQDSDR